MRLAIPTKGNKGLKDRVSEVFSKAPTLTIVEWDGQPHLVEVADNPAANMSQGAGPLATKILKDKGVEVLLCGSVGVGVSTILEGYHIKHVKVEPDTSVTKAVSKVYTLWDL